MPSANTNESCTFHGSVRTLWITGVGPARLTEGEAFEGATKVTITGARIGASPPQTITVERPALLVPIGENAVDRPYEVKYRAGPKLTIEVTAGGSTGALRGKLDGHAECAAPGASESDDETQGSCPLVWAGDRKTITLERRGDAHVALASGFESTGPQRFVHEIRIIGANGELRCGDKVTKLVKADRVWTAGASRSLNIEESIRVTASGLVLTVVDETPPESPLPLGTIAAGGTATILVAAGAAVVWRRRRAAEASLPLSPVDDRPAVRYHALICHAPEDAGPVEVLAAELRAAGLELWLDEERIGPGESILERIEEGLMESAFVIVCISRDLRRSRWKRPQYGPILDRELKMARGRMLPLIVGDYGPRDVPPALADKLSLDARSSADVKTLIRQLKTAKVVAPGEE